jgi:hypothetical protein
MFKLTSIIWYLWGLRISTENIQNKNQLASYKYNKNILTICYIQKIHLFHT